MNFDQSFSSESVQSNIIKNELNFNLINFSGNIKDANVALRGMTFEPLCPFDSDNII